MRRHRLVRIVASVVAAALAVAAAVVVVYRVLAPSETLTRPTVPYPEAVVVTDERPFSELRAAPLVLEGRLRVYAEKWRVWSDAPVGERYESTPYWAFRRWPAEVVGVAAAQTVIGPIVVTQWSDGQLIALDARRGEVAWRAQTPAEGRSYDGRRTGASVVYEPRSLRTVRHNDGTALIVTNTDLVTAFDAATGEPLWRRVRAGGCEPSVWTGASLVVIPDCPGTTLTFVRARDGAELGLWPSPEPARAPVPQLCELGRTECRLIGVGSSSWLLGPDATLVSVPSPERGAHLAGDLVVYPSADGVAARRLRDEDPLWTWSGQGELISADGLGVYLITEDRTVLGLSPATGQLASVGCASSSPNEEWRIGHVQPTGSNYLVLERITSAPPEADDQQYYFGPRPIALVELYPPTKLPVWPGKFAACRRPV
ncbi:MAG TPA: PQQ-binding-like beta-propeller repeat protein [Micromonosporaceae bacterium]|nr:PQQ-binding-like beta-propeller repeat protein [Micromonosporaceae bacterium]